MKKVKILNITFDACTKDEALARIFDVLENRKHENPKHIVTPNPEMLLEAAQNNAFADILNSAWLSIPDGTGILWAASFNRNKPQNKFFLYIKAVASLFVGLINPNTLKKVIPERITGVDLMESICAISSKKNPIPIFLLGAKAGVSEKVKKILEIKYPGLNIVGTFSGSPDENDFIAIKAIIAETRPEVLFVAYGFPKQEFWINAHLKELQSVKIAMGVGGAFDFIAGERKRAPKWIRSIGLEWLFRLTQEPSRIKRIYNAVIRFPLLSLRSRLK